MVAVWRDVTADDEAAAAVAEEHLMEREQNLMNALAVGVHAWHPIPLPKRN